MGIKIRVLSFLGSWIIRLLGKTIRISRVNSESWKSHEKVVFGFWHGEQFLLCYDHKNQGVFIMTSLSKDGEIQTGILQSLGYRTVRGSSSRGAERALVEMIRAVKKYGSAAFAVDGPKGPIFEVKPGVVYLALKAGVPLIPVSSCAKKRFILSKAWDKYELPHPFTKAVITYGDPVQISENDDIEAKRKEFENSMKKQSEFAHGAYWQKDIKQYLAGHPNPKIMIIQPSRIGDVVFALPVLSALRKKYPGARISWFVDERCAPLLADVPGLDEIVVFDRTKVSLSYLLKLKKELHAKDIDVSIDLHGLFKSALMAALAGAKFKIASSSTYGMKELSWLVSKEAVPDKVNAHCVQRHLSAARFLGCADETPEYNLNVTDEIKQKVLRRLSEKGIDPSKPMVVMHPGGGWLSRRWYPERFAELADMVSEKLSAQVLLVGGKEGGSSERGLNEIIVSKARNRIHDLTGLLDLKELAGLFKISRMFIGNEAGPMHIAVALDIPVIALIGPTNPDRTGPYGSNVRIVRHSVGCQPCRERNCRSMECMKRITAEEVFSAVREIYK